MISAPVASPPAGDDASVQLAVGGDDPADLLASPATQIFVHPGGLLTQADLYRMKTEVAAGADPWIDDWNVLITDSHAQLNYHDHSTANMGSSRQNADADAIAVYLDTLRWYISGDTRYAAQAVTICNDWSSKVNVVPSGTDIPGLIGIAIADFAMGRRSSADLFRLVYDRFQCLQNHDDHLSLSSMQYLYYHA